MTNEPETWLGNIKRCCCEVGFNPLVIPDSPRPVLSPVVMACVCDAADAADELTTITEEMGLY